MEEKKTHGLAQISKHEGRKTSNKQKDQRQTRRRAPIKDHEKIGTEKSATGATRSVSIYRKLRMISR